MLASVASHRFFEHTGDFGVELTAPTEDSLLAELVPAFAALLTSVEGVVEARESVPVEVEGIDLSDLLVVLGNELLYRFEAEGFLAAELAVEELTETRLVGALRGERYDPERHPIARPAKAVTQHGVGVEARDGELVARVIFDL